MSSCVRSEGHGYRDLEREEGERGRDDGLKIWLGNELTFFSAVVLE